MHTPGLTRAVQVPPVVVGGRQAFLLLQTYRWRWSRPILNSQSSLDFSFKNLKNLKTRRTMPGKEAGKAKPLKQKVRDKEGRMHAQNHVLTY